MFVVHLHNRGHGNYWNIDKLGISAGHQACTPDTRHARLLPVVFDHKAAHSPATHVAGLNLTALCMAHSMVVKSVWWSG